MLGIDLAPRATGICLLSRTGICLRTWTIEEKLSRGSRNDPPVPQVEVVRRMLRVANRIVEIIKDFEVRHVGLEGYAFGAKFQSHQIGEVAGVVKSQLWMNFRIVPEIVPPKQARKHVLGYGGKVTKEEIVKAVRDGLNIDAKSDHEADAAVVARWTFDLMAAREREIRVSRIVEGSP